MFGELIPEGGGDPIPLLKEELSIGRRDECDIVLRFSSISAYHCSLEITKGYWFVKDLNSRNGTRVNGFRVERKRVDPGDKLSIARHDYRIQYDPKALGADGPPPDEDVYEEIMARSLLDGAGLSHKEKQLLTGRVGRKAPDLMQQNENEEIPSSQEAESAGRETTDADTAATQDSSESGADPENDASDTPPE